MPPGAFVVESGVYKVGADREWERPEPIYWKQVVFGARNGSEGSGSMPRNRRVGRLVEEDIQRLKAMEMPNKLPSKAKLRASSPLDQNAPLIDFASPASEISTVEMAEKSIPSTLLTSRGLSSISSPLESSRSMRQRSTLTSELTTLGTIPEQSYSEMDGSQIVQADVHPIQDLSRRQREELQKQLYWQRSTYRAAESLFPNYALNYPAPIHQHPAYQGSISPSIQYPEVVPPRYDNVFLPPAYTPQNPMMPQNLPLSIPLATSSPPLRSQSGSQPLGLPFTTSTRTSLHDYENMRYPVRKRRKGANRETSGNAENRDSFVIDGEILKRHRSDVSGDAVSLVSEVLDAEVTALTNSSPGSSNGSTTERVRSKKSTGLKKDSSTSSSGIASKNLTTSSSSASALETSKTGLLPIPESSAHMYYYYDNLPFYENWPPPKQIPPQVKPRILPGYQFVPPPDASSALVPPLIPHQSQNQAARPQEIAGNQRKESPIDTSLDTPPSAKGASRPGSAHSAPLLDLSIDRHYEFDTARTPTDDIALHHNQPLLLLPQKWNRPYLGYNPRRDRAELGAAAAAANRDRVFSDSEIYSPVFPRGKPDSEPRDDMIARVQAMKKEFAEYRQQQLEKQKTEPPPPPLAESPSKKSADSNVNKVDFDLKDDQRLESLI